jgi:hypothetical protein
LLFHGQIEVYSLFAQPSGYGLELFSDGSFYEGEWLKDERHGVGVFTSAQRTSYAGSWVEGALNGLAFVSRMNADGSTSQEWSRCTTYDNIFLLGDRFVLFKLPMLTTFFVC